MLAAGINLGGTNTTAHLFGLKWHFCHKLYLETPKTYKLLIEWLCEAIDWIGKYSSTLPIGVGSTGILLRILAR